ncbi:ras-related protein rap-2a precursor [Lynx pardinus]|uniref:Ras-related protein rap-2a n=1 Tax=Lynx pardinus TaxID=191816 RepID=A0A485MW42_LYNPA|nr:ras-related protein rap-2a precursor [Lynx pardinus]
MGKSSFCELYAKRRWSLMLIKNSMIYQNLLCKRYEKVPVILVGNKVDLESEREVSSNEGRALAEEWGCPFMETSAKSKTMVDELFAEIVRQMNYAAQPDKDDPCCSACNIQ